MGTTMGWMLVLLLALYVGPVRAQIFSENMGTPGSNTNVNTYTGWQNGAPITFSTTTGSDVRTTTPSTGYTGASGGGNVFMGTSGGNSKDFLIEGINSNGYSNLTLSFGLLKNNNNPIDLTVSVSSDGVNWTALAFMGPPSANLWVRTTASGTIPATSNLRIKFEKNSTIQYRIDDIELTGVIAGPLVNFNTATSMHSEAAGTVTVDMTINPVNTVASTLTITIGAGSTATYGAANDYTTAPVAGGGTTITLTVPANASTAQFSVIINDDLIQEADETIIVTLTNATGGTNIGGTDTHTLTIQDNDYYPTVEFVNTSVYALEGAGAQTITVSLTQPHPTTMLTIQVTNGPGAVYGAGNDYTTAPAGGGGTFVIGPFPTGAANGTFTITPLTDGISESTEYVTFTIISASAPTIVIGANSSCTFYIGDIDSPPAVLDPGDLVVVGVNANNGSCGGGSGEDQVSFFSFKEITYGTELVIADQGYERCNAGQWGNQEGTVRMKRTGPAIPAGQVITFTISNTSGPGNIVGAAPDAGWTCTNLNNPGGGINSVNLNVNGDQLFFMQGGTWTSGTSGGNNATYDGTILYAFSTNPSFPWSAHCSNTPNQRSNLPTGVECFSTAPTLASDFNKYTGPLTAATQRDWIIRLDNVANWSSYSSCAQYNSTGPDWMAAPILPIIPGAMTPGLWRGAFNQDWFECKNWDDARIPNATTDVLVNDISPRHCTIGLTTGLNPGGTAECASLSQVNGTSLRQVYVDTNATLNVHGRLLVENPGSAGNLTTQARLNATINADSVVIRGYGPAVNAQLQVSADGSRVNVTGDLTIDIGGRLNLLGTATTFGGTLDLGGDFINRNDESFFSDNYSRVILSGNSDQYIRNNNILENFYDLQINKTGGDVHLTAPIAVRNELDLTQGRVFSTAADLLTLNNIGTVINASDASFVHGPFKKIGNTDFTFPIGKEHSYRPASLSALSGNTSVAFTAEYFHHPTTGNPLGLWHDAVLHHVSDCEHWQIDRSNGNPNAVVTLSWRDPESCLVTLLADIRVAYWDGALWTDRGGNPVTGNATAGTVSTATVQNSFLQAANYWTLASLSSENPLPIELLSFNAVANSDQVDLLWATASERNNDHFTVERSANAVDFEPVVRVPGAGDSQSLLHYQDVDRAPLPGLSYYRLRQTDRDGTTEVSGMVPVFFHGAKPDMTVLYAADGLYLEHGFPVGSRLSLLDATGRVVAELPIAHEGLMRLPIEGLAHGAYVLRVTNGTDTDTARMAY